MIFTGEICNVTSFSTELDAIKDVEVCSACTAITLESTGQTLILEFGQGLWFGSRMKHSLINPNQCRSFGIPICDDPTDPYRKIGIGREGDSTFIPLETRGTILYFESFVPSDEDIQNCLRVQMSDPEYWDPSNPTFIKEVTINQVNKSEFHTKQRYLDDDDGFGIDNVIEKIQRSVIIADVNKVASETTIEGRRHMLATPEVLSRKWNIGMESARNTIEATTQMGVRTAIHPLIRRYRTDLFSLKYRRLAVRFYSDTLFSNIKSLNQNTCAQLFAAENFAWVYPMTSKSKAGEALKALVEDVGIPNELVVDGASEQVGKGSEFYKQAMFLQIKLIQSEPYTQKQNYAENVIGKVKQKYRRRKAKLNIPNRIWDYGYVWEAEVISRTVTPTFKRTGIEKITGDTPDISEWLDFSFYDLVWFWDTPGNDDNPKLGRFLGVAHRIRSNLCYWVLKANGQILARSTVQHVTKEDLQLLETKQKIEEFDKALRDRLNDANFVLPMKEGLHHQHDTWALDDEDDENMLQYMRPEDRANTEDDAETDVPAIDELINADIKMNIGGEPLRGRVKRRKTDEAGHMIGRWNDNPRLNTREYEVEFEDGSIAAYTANMISENLYYHIDAEGKKHAALSEIVDHKSDKHAVKKADGFIISASGIKTPKETTAGWYLLVEWKDGSQTWVSLTQLKRSNPVEVAEYAVGNMIDNEPAFNWWARKLVRQRNRMVMKVKSRYWKTNQKYGIRLPHSVAEALEYDRNSGTDYWRKAIQKEMKNLSGTFEKRDDLSIDDARSGRQLIGYTEIKCHMIFDIKLDAQFTRKARYVAGGHMTAPPTSISYSSVVTRESVRIAFMYAALNKLKCMQQMWETHT